jgi:hypothetical protein
LRRLVGEDEAGRLFEVVDVVEMMDAAILWVAALALFVPPSSPVHVPIALLVILNRNAIIWGAIIADAD